MTLRKFIGDKSFYKMVFAITIPIPVSYTHLKLETIVLDFTVK